jgi:hypothetical protein
MAKGIKFNLIVDQIGVRTIEQLKEHFSIEDILDHYKSGLLGKWLRVRGYEEQLNRVERITNNNETEMVTGLIEAFDMQQNNGVRIALDALRIKTEKTERLKQLQLQQNNIQRLIRTYHQQYQNIIASITKEKDNFPVIKKLLHELAERYMDLFRLNYRELYFKLMDSAPLAVLGILSHPELRKFFLVEKRNASQDTQQIHDHLKSVLQSEKEIHKIAGSYLKTYKTSTNAYWKDIEPLGTNCMIIRMESGCFIRNLGVTGEECKSDAVNNKFLIFNGLDYKSNLAANVLYYMEI